MRVAGYCRTFGLMATITATSTMASTAEKTPAARQITTAPHGHVLTNVNVWSPDSRWIIYDVRAGDAFDGTAIERVDVVTGKVERLYKSSNGATCGVVTQNPVTPLALFIHGPENPTAEWQYGFTHRRGAVLDLRRPGGSRSLDAMNYAPPFTPGALRGGSHVHVFSPDGQWVSFTYEDNVLARLGPDGDHDINQRNVGISVPAGPVRVSRNHPRNHDGDWFSVLVTHTVSHPRAGSDEIARACEEGWIGQEGYLRADGTRQRRALAFQGTVTALDGTQHAEVYVVDLPDDVTRAGDAPLEGTEQRRPAPPRGTRQRRVTFTDDRRHPGLASAPRHWLRCSPDGSAIAFLMKDDVGVVQLWTVSPNGGAQRQVTRGALDVASAFTWSPDGRWIAHAMGESVCVTEVSSGRTQRLTEPQRGDAASLSLACVFSPDGRKIAYVRRVATAEGAYQQIFTVDVPFSRQ